MIFNNQQALSTLHAEEAAADSFVRRFCSAASARDLALENMATPHQQPSAAQNIMIPPDFDFSKLTQAEAMQLLLSETTIIERQIGLAYPDALAQARLKNPKLVALLGSDVQITNRNNIQVSNPLAIGNDGIPPAPVFSPQMKTMLGLSAAADQEECLAAWNATKGVTTPRDGKAIWAALVALWSGRKQGKSSRTAVEMELAKSHPALAQELGISFAS